MVERERNDANSRVTLCRDEISGRRRVILATAYLFELTLNRWWAVWVLVLKYSSDHQDSKLGKSFFKLSWFKLDIIEN